MQNRQYISVLVLWLAALLFNACSNTQFLTDDQLLYTGRKKIEMKSEVDKKTLQKAENIVDDITFVQPNNALAGKRVLPPMGLWYFNYRQPPEGKRGGLFYRAFKKEPVLLSQVNPEQRLLKIESELFDNGYFYSDATFSVDTSKNNLKKIKLSYQVEVDEPFRLNNIIVPPPIDSLDTLINRFAKELAIFQGDIFNLEKLKDEKRKLASMMVNEGYFFFGSDNIEMIADTTDLPYKIDLLIRKRSDIEPYVLKKYSINNVVVKVQNSLMATPKTNADTINFDGIKITGQTDYLKPKTIARSVLFRSGDLYSETKHRGSIPLLNNYGVFSSVNILFSVADSTKQTLDILVRLIPKDNISLVLEGAVQAKSTGFTGPTSEITLAHGNIAKSANRLQVKAFGGFEWQLGKKEENELGSNSYNAGINSSFILPRMLVPFKSVRENKKLISKTAGTVGFEFINNVRYYRMRSVNSSFGYNWNKNGNLTHQLNPIRINIVSLQKTTEEFDSIVNNNPYVKKSFEEQTIIGPKYAFTLDNSAKTGHAYYFLGEIGTSGNLIDLFNGIGKSQRPYTFFGEVYSQFVKALIDFRYYNNTVKTGWVFRFYAGMGISYGNSSVMPYVEQFYSGGSNSLRGFTARSLGPGSYKPEFYNGIIDQTGDIRLELNSEYRFRLTEIMLGALFLETGNIWLLNNDENRPGAQFDITNFHKQLALGAGLGLRLDFNFFVLRGDFGFPLRYPYDDGSGHWNEIGDVFGKFKFNIAIGYPF